MRIRELLIVEGKYDAAKLSGLVDGLILTTGGFSIYRDREKRELIKEMGKKRGIIILTDSDAAGFQLRHYIQNFAKGAKIKNAYIPAIPGKEKRKEKPSKEGTLGVEGVPAEVLIAALRRAGATEEAPRSGRRLTYTDLYQLGISGTPGSAERRRALLRLIGLPLRLSKKALLETLDAGYTYEELEAICARKPVLLWDFHGTLTLPADDWFDALWERLPHDRLEREALRARFHHVCMPWWTMPGQHTPTGKDWWNYVQDGFTRLLSGCGYTDAEVRGAVGALRGMVTDPARHQLYPDAISTLAELQRRGYQNILVSNNFPELWQVATALGLAPYFSGQIVSGAVGWDKPSPEIFRLALAAAGNPAEAIMIGDNPIDDVQGALAVGLRAIQVHPHRVSEQAEARCETLAQLLDLLR